MYLVTFQSKFQTHDPVLVQCPLSSLYLAWVSPAVLVLVVLSAYLMKSLLISHNFHSDLDID